MCVERRIGGPARAAGTADAADTSVAARANPAAGSGYATGSAGTARTDPATGSGHAAGSGTATDTGVAARASPAAGSGHAPGSGAAAGCGYTPGSRLAIRAPSVTKPANEVRVVAGSRRQGDEQEGDEGGAARFTNETMAIPHGMTPGGGSGDDYLVTSARPTFQGQTASARLARLPRSSVAVFDSTRARSARAS
jgi:hypothetical protein